ncbi:MAG: ABC transporter permease [Chitinophagaceae bacterium]|nr:ABC transporter permease [Chitinophagaceae bacterium]MCW5926662.1 ABC transporter permease [Chitinophagaceae bacterium]
MFKNYFKIAWRNLLRNKWFSLINILGLSIGLATCLIIMLFVSNELGYDRFNKKANRIARIYFEGNVQGEKMKEPVVMAPVAQAVKKDFPEVEDATRLRSHDWAPKLVVNNKEFRFDQLVYADANFFDVFTLPFIRGDSKTALAEPNTVVLTKDVAKKYFGDGEALGQTIRFKTEDKAPMKVTGVIENIPANSHFRFGLLTSMASLEDAKRENWMGSNYFTYIVLKNKNDFEKLEEKLPGLVDKYIGPQMKDGLGQTLAEFRKSGSNITFHLQRLTDIHLYSDFHYDLSAPGNVRNVYIFSAIALFMLLIACINFMNLSTAGASKRSREVGIRKVLGSMKGELVKQFLVESTFIAAIALLLSLLFIQLALPLFNDLSGLQLTLSFREKPLLLPALTGIVLLTGLIAGSYPAFYLSSFKPVAVLKGKWNPAKSGVSFRSVLVVFQFFISIILIVSTTVVYKQLSYIRHKDVGYNKDKVMVISNVWAIGKNMDVFRKELQQDPAVAGVSASRYLPAGNSGNNNFFVSTVQDPGKLVKTLRYEIDEYYIPTLGIQLKAGRNFSQQYGMDSLAVIVNEAAVKALGWKEDPIGQTIARTFKEEGKETYQVVGVVKDFHFRSLHERISPLVLVPAPDPGNLVVKIKTTDIPGFTAKLQKQFTEYGAEDPMNYSFLDERYNNTYKAEQKIGTILGVFAGLTIFIACLGLFGLAKFTADQRIKEIGIRKVLGASAAQLSAMLSKDFLRLVLLACCIAFPIAGWVMHKWLQDFAYRTNISWWIFMIAGVVAVLIALITVSFQAIKAALANPVKALRTE